MTSARAAKRIDGGYALSGALDIADETLPGWRSWTHAATNPVRSICLPTRSP